MSLEQHAIETTQTDYSPQRKLLKPWHLWRMADLQDQQELPPELIKYGRNVKLLAELFFMCFSKCQIPCQWKMTHLILIYKKGRRTESGNYRDLSVNSTLSRLFGNIIKFKLDEHVKHVISEEVNSGFCRGKLCTDNLFKVQQLLEKRSSRSLETNLVFIDFQ